MTNFTFHSQGNLGIAAANNSATVTLCKEFSVSQGVTVAALWWFSPSSAVSLPNAIGIWDDTAGAFVAGSQVVPSWSGAAASGWVKHTYSSPPSLVSGHRYYTAVFNNAGNLWFNSNGSFWTSGAGSAGLTSGPLAAPSNTASHAGQNMNASGQAAIHSPLFSGTGKEYGTDIEVTVASATPQGPLMACFP